MYQALSNAFETSQTQNTMQNYILLSKAWHIHSSKLLNERIIIAILLRHFKRGGGGGGAGYVHY